ncbi:Putative glucan endo-1,3-beta-glucosidase btgC; AltName: Full=Endo-1,3-beta-glucanase btgC; AltName: Full=Laminarinase btgC [Serendipita indica DSM 11827]|uniref:glucan endo-1,3-beta-D-glucosidase n=1 Tax=Serendipita indica (strain DSM 11827) TaxID=1109443 RepID=G4TV84_SERID|nr:Putative glucan endo-1,3-beta-glucosidase btgC; AltName: Full=Endo-1,3-beta-glucanase btgC; AltName: Full=Laminarinase btgC [Serendipita indica DSM 11827]CCA75227.1 related to endo-beta-1,3-glucanase of the cell wall [Serendipita indica DSM 11827]
MLRATSIALGLASFIVAVGAADPSQWTADPRLHRSMWGIAYTAEHAANYPACGDTLDEVVRDVQLMSQLTTRIRTYGTDCNQLRLVQQAIQQTKTNLHVYAGIYIDGNETTFERQRDEAFAVFDQYGVDNVLGITVGNEYLLQAYTANPATLETAQTYLISKIQDVRTMLASKNYGKTIPVGSADAGSQITATYAQAADFIMANSHPFFSGVTIDGAAIWTAEYLVNEQPHFATDAGKLLLSSEVGWPTDAMATTDPAGLTLNGSIASTANLQTMLDTFVCATNANLTAGSALGHGYFWFELFDQEWKVQYGGAEPYWGLFDKDRNLKDITIPSCIAPEEAPVGNMGNNTGSGSSSGSSGNGGSGGSGSNGGSGNSQNGATGSNVVLSAFTALILAAVGGLALL